MLLAGQTPPPRYISIYCLSITGDPTFTPQNGNPPRDFVEVGVLLNNPAEVEQVRIYLPGNWDGSKTADRVSQAQTSHRAYLTSN